jgi:hypothetical protein
MWRMGFSRHTSGGRLLRVKSVVKHPFLQPSSRRDACSFTIGLGRVEG